MLGVFMSRDQEIRVKLWKARVTEWESSGKNIEEWCRDKDISSSTFSKWKVKFLGKSKKSLNQAIQSSPFKELGDEKEVGIKISVNGVNLKLSRNFDTETFLQCITALNKLSC
jgi:hypothetical protein